jgi:hypothetical protein
MASLLNPSGVITAGSAAGQSLGSGKKRRTDEGVGELPAEGGKRTRAVLGFATNEGIYPTPQPSCLIMHKREALPTNSPQSTLPAFSLKAGHNELIS